MGKRICVNRKIHTEDQPHKSQPYYKSKLLPKKKKVHALNCSESQFEAAMGRPRWTKPLSQETERNLNLGKYVMRKTASPLI